MKPIVDLLEKDKEFYKNIRKICNDYTHYNKYLIFLYNDNELFF